MSRADDIKYRGVPLEVSRPAADACWECINEVDLAIRELEEVGKVVANARLTAEPAEWTRRTSEGKTLLAAAKARLSLILARIEEMERHAPQ